MTIPAVYLSAFIHFLKSLGCHVSDRRAYVPEYFAMLRDSVITLELNEHVFFCHIADAELRQTIQSQWAACMQVLARTNSPESKEDSND